MILSIGEKIIITVITEILTGLSGAYNFARCAELSDNTTVSVTLRFLFITVAIGTVPSLMMYFLWR